jgi:2-polyprenyl-6-methoxyphenol hydroxylase-like FAD-dependent oxidoreductase
MDFVVAGGGIGGAVLAELLARGGTRVVVLERNHEPPTWTRPEIFWPATAEFLSKIAPREVWEQEAARPLEGIDIHDGRALLPLISSAVFERAGVRPWSTDPNALRELLLARASFELRRGVEVVGLLREGARVVGVRAREVATGKEIDVPARWTVGDDGVRSVVREGCGIPIALRTFPLDLLCFGPAWPPGLPASRVRLWANRGRTASGILGLGAVPLPRGRGTGLVFFRPQADEDPRTAPEWERFLALDPLLGEVVAGRRFPADFTLVRRRWGHAERYGIDGAVLIGDAAHPVSPAGGQGSSMAVADARALAEILLSGSRDPIAEYERRRRPANERSLAITRLAHRAWSLPRWCRPTPLFFGCLAFLRARPSLLVRAIRDVSTRFLEEAAESP